VNRYRDQNLELLYDPGEAFSPVSFAEYQADLKPDY
jgi:hypothetical protein